MPSTTFAVGSGSSMVDAGHGPHSPASGGSHHHNSSTNSASTGTTAKSFTSNNSVFDAHRQNHNSSKLPAFRFADLKKDAIVLPSLLQHIPPSPVSPQPGNPERPADGCPQQLQQQQYPQDAHDQAATNQQIPGPLPDGLHNYANLNVPDKPPTPETQTSQLKSSPPRTRTSTFQIPTIPATANPNPPTGSKRPASFPDAPSVAGTPYAARTSPSSTATPIAKRRLTASGVASSAESATIAHRASNSADDQNSTREWAQGQRELLLPKTIESAKADERRKSRPPVSYRPPNVTGGRAVIPPIRSFRSSGSRKSLVLDMHVRRASEESYGEDITDPNQRDRTLRALEGRSDDDFSQITPPDSAEMGDGDGDGDNTADIFMRIAREDPGQVQEEQEKPVEQSAISRITRTAHRRPLSTNVPTYQAASPPQLTRRLSDQRENTRARGLSDVQSPQIPRESAYRSSLRDRTTTGTTASEETVRSQPARTPLRPSPITPRQLAFQDAPAESVPSYRRRQSVTESNTGYSANRPSPYRSTTFNLAQSRIYNSSPLVPKSIDLQKQDTQQGSDMVPGVEGTESSASTAAPSTVWDELDDLKSRIHRLELTGKAPPTSGAAMSRVSDDRPPTATTNATTMSASPKRGNGTQPDASSTTSSHKESQPLLMSALSKTRGLVSMDVYEAIETAATDALALQSMMGAPGQPGPISSGASTIGAGGNVTDRQLRRKADSICRSLTELCIALADEVVPLRPPPLSVLSPHDKEKEVLTASPTVIKLPPAISQRRPSTLADTTAPKPLMSPRAPTSLEQRRISMLASTTVPSPRFAAAPSTPMESSSAGRKTSLLLSRTRRAGTEEPEEATGRRSSLLLRTRRAGTEEPEEPREGRKTSLLLRTRKATNEDDDEPRFRVPSRAVTEVNSFRSPRETGKNPVSPPDDNSLGSSALPRRRLVPSSLNPRLVAPSAQTTPTTPNRRYLVERPMPDRESNSVAEKLAEDRGQRQFSLSQTAVLNRTGSINRRTRDSGIPSVPAANTTSGSYR